MNLFRNNDKTSLRLIKIFITFLMYYLLEHRIASRLPLSVKTRITSLAVKHTSREYNIPCNTALDSFTFLIILHG